MIITPEKLLEYLQAIAKVKVLFYTHTHATVCQILGGGLGPR